MDLSRLTATLCIALLACAVQWAPADDNLITNPGFEELDEDAGFATAWEPTYWSNPNGKAALSDEARGGERCVVVTGVPPDTITDATPRNNNMVAQRIEPPVVGMRKLQLRAGFRAAENATAYMSMIAVDKDGNQLQYVSSRRVSDQDEWSQLLLPISTDPDTAQLTVYLRNEGEGPVWYDDVSLAASDDVLENELLRVHVEPLVGGRLRAFFSKTFERDLTFWSGVRPGGLAAEIVPGDAYPGALRDAACEMKVLQPRRRVLITHGPMPAPMDGLVIEKEISLREGAPVVDVLLRVTNRADGERTIRLRPQQCLPPGERLVTCPIAGGLRVVRPQPGLMKWGMDVTELTDGWIACTDLQGDGGMVFLFDKSITEKAYLYSNQDLQTVEWYYEPMPIPAGGKWETTYTIAALPSSAPVVAAGGDLAIGLAPLSVGKAGRHSVVLSALRASVQAHLSARATGEAALPTVTQHVTATPPNGSSVQLPWEGSKLQRIELSARVGEAELTATIARDTLDESPLMDLPPPPERVAEFPAAIGFFPYGEYYRGVVGAEAGSQLDQVKRFLRAYRRCYMNTYMVGEYALMPKFRDTGSSPVCELARKRRMRLIPRADMMRRFARDETGKRGAELPPPDRVTREVALERVGAAYSMDLRRSFVQEYGDLILAYDFADEPQGQYIPLYMMVQSVYREVDPDHPVLVILNLNRTEFLPYMPIYYGDEYPIRSEKRGGRNPWTITKRVRFCATHTDAPVWVMLQAFGGLAEYTWQLPNKAEQRLTLYETIANGGKGITFHGSCSPPCWRYNQYYFYPAMDSWLAETPAWEAMREEGRYITAIGPALLSSNVTDDAVLNIECEQIVDAGQPYHGPAVKAGVLKRREGGWFAVVVNQDVEQTRAATVTVNTDLAPGTDALYDLYELKQIGPAVAVSHAIELEPGDGRIFFLGAAEQADAVIATVHKGHYDNELPLYEIDAELAQANGCDLTAAIAAAQEAARAYQADDYEEAHRGILEARAEVAKAVGVHAALSSSLAAVEKTHELLSEIARVYRDNFDVVMPPEDRKATRKYVPFTNERDPKMQDYVDRTADAFCRRLKLEDRLYAGEAEQAAGEAQQLLETVRRLHAEAIPYVRQQAL